MGTTCAPTRSGIITGLNCNSAGVWHTIGGASLLRKGVQTLPEVLGQHGYATGLFGKWHLGDDYPYRPQDRGFQHAVYHRGGGLTQISDHWGNNYMDDTYLVNGEAKAFKGYCTDVFFDEAFTFIRSHREEPFLCLIAPNAPHAPYNVESRYRDLYADEDMPEGRKRFYGMISNIDDNFHRLETLLHDLDIEDNTIVIFMTDNGTAKGCEQDGNQFITSGYNGGMRGRKASPFEGGHRVPFFLRYPAGGIDGGRDVGALAHYTDVMPTLLDLCGVKGPEMEGESLLPLLEDDGAAAAEWKHRALVVDTQRIPHPIKWRLSAVMKGNFRLINGRELYDLSTDPEQREDVAVQHPKVVADLRAEYETWWDLCSRQFNHASPTHIGSEVCPEVKLTTMELRNDDSDVVWHQGQVRAAQSSLGWWELLAEQDGRYSVVLRRWPEEAGHGMVDGIQGFDVDPGPKGLIDTSVLSWYRDGKAVDVYGAALKVDEQNLYADIEADAGEVTFVVDLKEGMHTLRAWFSGGTDVRTATVMAPYYVTIKRMAGD